MSTSYLDDPGITDLPRSWSKTEQRCETPITVTVFPKLALETKEGKRWDMPISLRQAVLTLVAGAATAGAASSAARRQWETGEDLDDLAYAPSKKEQAFRP